MKLIFYIELGNMIKIYFKVINIFTRPNELYQTCQAVRKLSLGIVFTFSCYIYMVVTVTHYLIIVENFHNPYDITRDQIWIPIYDLLKHQGLKLHVTLSNGKVAT